MPIPGFTPGRVIPEGITPEELVVVPDETPFTVELVTELDSNVTRAGDPFRARMLSPLATVDRQEVVAPGAILWGHVVRVEQAPATLYLKFEEVDTKWGPTAIAASLSNAQSMAAVETLPRDARYDGVLRRRSGVPLDGLAIGGGPPSPLSRAEGTLSPILLVSGTRLQLELTSPLEVQKTMSPPPPSAP
jgi:hypothetical protein